MGLGTAPPHCNLVYLTSGSEANSGRRFDFKLNKSTVSYPFQLLCLLEITLISDLHHLHRHLLRQYCIS